MESNSDPAVENLKKNNPDYSVENGVGMSSQENQTADKLDFLLDIPVEITVEVGRTSMLISDLLKLGHGSIIELLKISGESMEVLANQKLIAKGEVVSVENSYGVRLTEILSPKERVESLK